MHVDLRRSFLLCATMATAFAAPDAWAAGAPPPKRGAARVAYAISTGPAGEIVLSGRSGALRFEKSVASDGRTSLVLRSGGDELRIDVSAREVAVTDETGRHAVPVSVAARPGVEAEARAIRVALAGSRAAQAFRALSARLSQLPLDGSYDYAVVLSGALVSQLAGEPGAIREFARRQHAARSRRIRPVALRQIVDCWGQYEAFISWAWDKYLGCLVNRTMSMVLMSYCEAQYYMRGESAWFQFLSCSTIPLK